MSEEAGDPTADPAQSKMAAGHTADHGAEGRGSSATGDAVLMTRPLVFPTSGRADDPAGSAVERVVHVSIGRVEIRGDVAAGQVADRGREPRRRPAMGLEEYLRRRGEERPA